MHCASSSAFREHASIRQESGKFPARNQHVFFLLVSEPICVSESMSTSEVERVNLHTVDHAAVTQTEYGPLRTRDLQDPPPVRLQEQQQGGINALPAPPPCVCVCSVYRQLLGSVQSASRLPPVGHAGGSAQTCRYRTPESPVQSTSTSRSVKWKQNQTNHVAWMPKVGVTVAKADSPIGQSQQVDFLVGGDSRPVSSLPDAIHAQSGNTTI